MKFKVKYLQEGGTPAPAPAPETAPQGGAPEQGGAPQEGGQDPLMEIAQLLATSLQSQDCAGLAKGAEMFLQLIAQAQGGAQGGAEGGAPAEQPVYMKKGGKFVLKKKVKGEEAGVKGDNKNVKTPKMASPNSPAMADKGKKMAKGGKY